MLCGSDKEILASRAVRDSGNCHMIGLAVGYFEGSKRDQTALDGISGVHLGKHDRLEIESIIVLRPGTHDLLHAALGNKIGDQRHGLLTLHDQDSTACSSAGKQRNDA